MQKKLELMVSLFHDLQEFEKQLVNIFNNHTGLYHGDPLFETPTSPICKYWTPTDEEEELFMNYNCDHPDADRDFGDTGSCCIMSCPDEALCEQPGGMIVAMLSTIRAIHMTLVGDIFNKNHDRCIYNKNGECDLENDLGCCIAKCPL